MTGCMADREQVVVFEEVPDHFLNKYAQLDSLREEAKKKTKRTQNVRTSRLFVRAVTSHCLGLK